jgi:UDP-N-acetylmuramoyl-L-alanyl-D-glutamate--2,6-diaminopimelate ligase
MTPHDAFTLLRSRGLLTGVHDGDANRALTGIAYDSRRVQADQLFVALKGLRADGATFVKDAIDRGAAAVVSESVRPEAIGASWATVTDARASLAVLADAFFGHPSAEMQVVGITGTNGKTTTAHLVASIFDAAGGPCGVMGTVGHRIGTELRDATHTTPEAPDVQALPAKWWTGCGARAMEVSSHALTLRRVDSASPSRLACSRT